MTFFKKKKQEKLDCSALVRDCELRHIAFIMDGNGRWATKRSLPREAGHKVGVETFRRITRMCSDYGIKTVTVYAFSTENWKRPAKEVNALIALLDRYLEEAKDDNEENKIRYIFLGDKSALSDELREKCIQLEKLTEDNSKVLNIALNYGGRAEIVHAVNSLIAEGKREITEDDISSALYTKLSPDPDLIVRTGCEIRLSNFLMWQSAYSELYFTDTLWPDYSEADLTEAIVAFAKRKRRFGGI